MKTFGARWILVAFLLGAEACDRAEPRERSSNAARCGDGVPSEAESCDDGNASDGDGCSAMCRTELGFRCAAGAPSTCAPICGDGLRVGTEACDDGASDGVDGCTNACVVRRGWFCDDASPSFCRPTCGDGSRTADERCDDGNLTDGDGCDGACQVEPGFVCDPVTALCTAICGDGLRVDSESCDDGNTRSGDGCSPSCVRLDVWRSIDVSPERKLPLDGLAVWAGSEVFLWGGRRWSPRMFNPAEGVWRNVPDAGPFIAAEHAVVLWTGHDLFVLGDSSDSTTAGLFDPSSNHWREVSSEGIPSVSGPRVGVWTGSSVVVFGGVGDDTAGGIYDVITDRWRAMSRVGAPAVGSSSVLRGVWSHDELLVLSFRDVDGALSFTAYSPETDQWRTLSTDGLPTTLSAPVVALGHEEVFLLVDSRSGGLGAFAYDVRADAWRSLATPPIPNARFASWTGSEFVVVGAQVANSARYVPALEAWFPVRYPGLEPLVAARALVTNGSEVFLHTTADFMNDTPVWVRLDDGAQRWAAIPRRTTIDLPDLRVDASSIWAGDALLWLGGVPAVEFGKGLVGDLASTSGWRYSPARGEWSRLGAEFDPRRSPLLLWTGTEVIIWGGTIASKVPVEPLGIRYDPVRNDITRIDGRRSFGDTLAVWTGREMLTFCPTDVNSPRYAAYDPIQRTWRPISERQAPTASVRGAVILGPWAVFFGGFGLSRYNIESDAWLPVSMQGSPVSGAAQIAPVTARLGDELVVLNGAALGVYDPARDLWRTIDVPAAYRDRLERVMALVYTGSVLVFFLEPPVDGARSRVSGVIYDLADRRWWTTPEEGAPLSDPRHTFIWTGSEILVWGGLAAGGLLPL